MLHRKDCDRSTQLSPEKPDSVGLCPKQINLHFQSVTPLILTGQFKMQSTEQNPFLNLLTL